MAGRTLQIVDCLDMKPLVQLLGPPLQVAIGKGGLIDALTLTRPEQIIVMVSVKEHAEICDPKAELTFRADNRRRCPTMPPYASEVVARPSRKARVDKEGAASFRAA